METNTGHLWKGKRGGEKKNVQARSGVKDSGKRIENPPVLCSLFGERFRGELRGAGEGKGKRIYELWGLQKKKKE